jgi:hypothetical protein
MAEMIGVTVAACAALAAGLGCHRTAPPPDVDPVAMTEAKAFAARFARVANPCDRGKIDPMFDFEAFGARYRHGESTLAVEAAAHEIERNATLANVLCAWQAGAESYQLLRVRIVDGQPRPLFRRVGQNTRTHVSTVNYDELMLGASRRDHKVRVIDVYSYSIGQWVSELLRSTTDAVLAASKAGEASGTELADKMKRARALQQSGQHQEALALLDALPPSVRKTRATQVMRVALASALSQPAYQQALDEIAATFPGDPSVALLEVDGALLRKDHAAALRYVDQVDAAIGGDAWQDAIRAEILIQRGAAGDLDVAQARADAAVTADPTLAKSWWARLDVALARQAWPAALAAMDKLHTRFHVAFPPETLRDTPVYRGLVASPEYAAWQAGRE